MHALKIAKKDVLSLMKEKTIALAVLLLISISSASQIIALGLTYLYSPSFGEEITIGLVGNAPLFEEIANPLKFESLDLAILSLKRGEIDAVVVLNENMSGTNYVEVFIPKEEFKAIKVIPELRRIFMEYQDKMREYRGIPTLKIRAFDNGYVEVPEGISIRFRFMYTVLIPLLATLTAIILGVYTIDIFFEEKRVIEVLLCCVKLRDVVLGKVIAVSTVSILLTLVWILGLILNGVEMNLMAFASSYILYVMSVSLAMITIRLSRDREESQLMFSLILIPLLLSFLTINPSPLSLIVKSSLSIFDSSFFLFLVIDLTIFLMALKFIMHEKTFIQ